MTALSEYRKIVDTEYPPTDIELEDGFQVRLYSVTTLKDDQLAVFTEAQQKLTDASESEDYVLIKTAMADVLATCSSAPDKLREALAQESMGVLTAIYKDFTSKLDDATKSGSDS